MKQRKPLWTPFVPGEPEFDGAGGKLFVNSRYQASIRGIFTVPPFGRYCELSLKRRDKEAMESWRDIQAIKNTFFGKSTTLVQVFPPEKYLVDTANQYYFYALLEYELPFGFKDRLVTEGNYTLPDGHTKQTPFEPHHRPENLEADERAFQLAHRQLLDSIEKSKR